MKNKRLLSALAIACFLVAAFVPWQDEALAYSETVRIPVSTVDDCIVCDEFPCVGGEHMAYESQFPNWQYNDGPHTQCNGGSCAQAHGPSCLEPEFEQVDLEMLRSLVAEDDAKAINTILSARREQVALNVARSAIQVTNCNQEVIAHFPVSRDLITSLTVE